MMFAHITHTQTSPAQTPGNKQTNKKNWNVNTLCLF